MRTIFVLLALAFLPVLCKADPIGVTDYQINIAATWIETNPACVSNCTENMNISYRFELNLNVLNPNSPTAGIYGWVDLSTLQESSSGFLGSFAFTGSTSGLWADDLQPSVDAPEFHNSLTDEIDLGVMGPGLYNRNDVHNGGPDMNIYDCFSEACHNAFSPPFQTIQANYETSTAVALPAGDSAWELVFVSAIVCTFGLFVKHRLGLTPTRQTCKQEKSVA
jgi:hypothetical protein